MLSKRLIIVTCSLVACLVVATASAALVNTKYTKPLNLNTVKYHQVHGHAKKQIDCLATNIYREAGYEPKEGQIAVAMVTLNRVQSGNYANSVCDVVHQRTGKTYQFSWVGLKNLPAMNANVYKNILELATLIYMNQSAMKDPTHGATYYHATYVRPGWNHLERVNQIGQHIFYRSNKDI